MRPAHHTIRRWNPPFVALLFVMFIWQSVGHNLAAQDLQKLNLLITDQTALSLPNTFGIVSQFALNQAGDYIFTSGNSSAVFLRTAGAPSASRLLQMGDPLPGFAHSRADLVSNPLINASGKVCFQVDFSIAGILHGIILKYDGSGLQTVAFSGDPAPGTSSDVYGRLLALIGINDPGDIAFTAPLVPSGPPGIPSRNTIYIAPAGGTPPVRIVGPGDTAPGTGGGTFDLITGMALNSQGEVLFRAAVVGGSGGAGLFAGSIAGGLRKIAANGDTRPGGGTFAFTASSSALGGARWNNAGQAAFLDSNAVYVSSPSTPPALAVSLATPVPATPGGSLTAINALSAFNGSGEIAFSANLSIESSSPALFRYRPAVGLETVAFKNQPAPGTTGQNFSDFSAISMNSSGQVSFKSTLTTGPTYSGIFQQTGSGPPTSVVLHDTATPLPGGGIFALNYGSTVTLNDGSVYFQADVKGGAADFGAFLKTAIPGFKILISTEEQLPGGSRISLRTWRVAAGGNCIGFFARKAGGPNSLWIYRMGSAAPVRVVSDGDAMPWADGGLVRIGNANTFFLNDDGNAAFGGIVIRDTYIEYGVIFFKHWDDQVIRLVGNGDPEPASGRTFSNISLTGFAPSPFNNHEQVLFRAGLSGLSGTGIFIARPGSPPAKVVFPGDPAPGGGTFATMTANNNIGAGIINQLGQVAFTSTTSLGTTGIFIGSPGSPPSQVVATGDPAPGGGTFSSLPAPSGFNDDGEVVFVAALSGGAGGGVFVGTAGAPPQAVALSGSVAPAGGNYVFSGTPPDALINNQGDVVLRAPLTGGSADSGYFLRRGRTGSLQAVALQGQVAPGTTGVFSAIQASTNQYPGENFTLGPTGEVVFSNYVNIAGTYVYGMFRYRTSNTLEKLLLRGDPAVGSGSGMIATSIHGGGAGRAGRFTFWAGIADGDFSDAIYTTTVPSQASDFDGDGIADVTVWRPDTGVWYTAYPNQETFTATQWGLPTDLPATGDYDGDGKADIAVWRPDSGVWYIIPSTTPSTYIGTQWGVSTDVPLPADYDGDGKTDIAVWRPSTGIWYILPSHSPSTYIGTQWGLPDDIPVPGDYDGDGKIDVAVWRPSSGVWYILPSNSPSTFISTQWGLVSDVPVPADYDGDGRTDIAVWRPSSGVWYILPSYSPGTYRATQWGVQTDTAVTGDYDGDGLADFAVYRSSTGTWYGILSSDPSDYGSLQWGLPTDVPISALHRIQR